MRLVLDTNVFLTALMSSDSPSAQVLNLWFTRNFELLTTSEQFEEMARVTRYPRIRNRVTPAFVGRLVNRLRKAAILLDDLPRVTVSPDPDDNYLLALAEAGQAQFLVTGDKPLLALKHHKSTHIVTPAALLSLLKD